MSITTSVILIIICIIAFSASAASDFGFGAVISGICIVACAWNIYNVKTHTQPILTLPKDVEYKYPSKDYTIDYEIITRSDQVDTVYVITRKNFE